MPAVIASIVERAEVILCCAFERAMIDSTGSNKRRTRSLDRLAAAVARSWQWEKPERVSENRSLHEKKISLNEVGG
ncbi:hypothetical protein NPIL_655791 [Nephila pilipes]|uniref:Uncharacterized protein n=1 Tax=Nephila pilipes TaxID=299642 RepID=A0A8X6M681_NEPPI|nr:hypothetical protein NPIL_655791 [Nephila pilipes]